MQQDEKLLFETTPATHFNEAYPIGNGRLGGMVYGTLPVIRVGLNLDELWSGARAGVADRFTPDAFHAAREAVMAGKYAEAEKLLCDAYARYDSGDYLPFGDLTLTLPDGTVTDYYRSLDLGDAVARVTFLLDGKRISLSHFASFPDGVIAVALESAEPVSVTAALSSPLDSATSAVTDALCLDGVCPLVSERQRGRHSSPFGGEETTVRFTGALGVVTDGSVTYAETGIRVTSARYATFLFAAASSFRDGRADGREGWHEQALHTLRRASGYPAQALLERHIADHRSLFDRMDLTFTGPDRSQIPTSARIAAADPDADPHLLALAFHFGRYLLIAGSRPGSRALNLQGIWNDSVTPPWGSEYTANINAEMNYWSALPIGCPELLDPMEELIRTVADTGRDTARYLFGAGGTCANHNLDIFGFSLPVTGQARWSFFPLSLGWMMRELFERYRYTGDTAYLRSVYPLFAENARFIADCLTDDGDYLIFAPGTSAENAYRLDGREIAVARSTAFFGAIVRDSFARLLAAAEILGIEDDLTARVREMTPRLLPPLVTGDGRIAEWYFGRETPAISETEVHHRHLSHLYDLYPARRITRRDPVLFAAARRSLDVRGDDATGWSLGWKICCRAATGDGDATERLLRLFLRPVAPGTRETMAGGGVYPNLFCAHPPFQIDGNFALVAGVIEMLVSADLTGEVHLLPALPAMLRRGGTLTGACLPGGRKVNLTWHDGDVVTAEIEHGV